MAIENGDDGLSEAEEVGSEEQPSEAESITEKYPLLPVNYLGPTTTFEDR